MLLQLLHMHYMVSDVTLMCVKQRHANHTLLGDIPPPPLHSKTAGMRLFLVGFDYPTLGVEGTCHGNS